MNHRSPDGAPVGSGAPGACGSKRPSEDDDPILEAIDAVPRGRLVGAARGALERVLLHGPSELLLVQPQVRDRIWLHRGPPFGVLGPRRRSMSSRYGRTPARHIRRNHSSSGPMAFISGICPQAGL